MLLLRLFLRGIIVHLVVGGCFAKQQLRQVRVVSVGEANVECDDAKGAGCGDAENGVLLLPEGKAGGKERWHAFNVHALMLPQHAASVVENVNMSDASFMSEASFAQIRGSLSKLDIVLHNLKVASGTSTLLLLGVVALLACFFINQFSSTLDGEETDRKESDFDDGMGGSWARAYRDARGSRRVALDLLFRSGIIPNQDMCRVDINPTFIEECIQIAEAMLQERSELDWVDQWQEAQQIFEERRTAYYKGHDMMAPYQFSDGSWAYAYRESEGQRNRQEAFELLLRLGIISSDEFANSLVPPKLIEGRIAVSMDLLRQKSLKEWVDLCETADGRTFKETVLACFAVQPGVTPHETPRDVEELSRPEWNKSPVHSPVLPDAQPSLSHQHTYSSHPPPPITTSPSPVKQISFLPAVISPRSAPSTAPSLRLAAGERPRILPHSSSLNRGTGSPRNVSTGFPVRMVFSNTAISGSSWEASAITPPRTPPGTPGIPPMAPGRAGTPPQTR